jgi:hypothetical protein
MKSPFIYREIRNKHFSAFGAGSNLDLMAYSPLVSLNFRKCPIYAHERRAFAFSHGLIILGAFVVAQKLVAKRFF